MAETSLHGPSTGVSPSDYIAGLTPEQIDQDQKLGIKAIRLFAK